jgi:kynurenine formamidase
VPRFVAFLVAAAVTGCNRPPEGGIPSDANWIDLSHDFSSATIYWPTARPFSLEVVSAQQTPAGYYYAANNFCAAEHGGTHLDAPIHFAEGKLTADQIPIDRLVGNAIVIDVRTQARANADYLVRPEELSGWEREHGPIPASAIVLIRTGWGSRWPDRSAYLGTARKGPEAVPELHFPGIDSLAARGLVNRKVRAVGIDTPSIDYGQSNMFWAHRILSAANIPAFENLANLERLPSTGSFVIALPMKIKGGSGGPLRIVAAVPR